LHFILHSLQDVTRGDHLFRTPSRLIESNKRILYF
jgi:hypothetical protein